MITTIDGWAGAGKTTLASHLAQTFSDRGSVFIVHMDDLYQGWDDPLGQALTEALTTIVHAHLNKESFTFSAFNWITMAPGDEIAIPVVDHLILEGVGAGQRAIRDHVDSKIWVEIEPVVGLQRVLERDEKIVTDPQEFEKQMRRFQDLAAAHFATEGTVFAADFEVNGQSRL
jgi:uridine kinase